MSFALCVFVCARGSVISLFLYSPHFSRIADEELKFVNQRELWATKKIDKQIIGFRNAPSWQLTAKMLSTLNRLRVIHIHIALPRRLIPAAGNYDWQSSPFEHLLQMTSFGCRFLFIRWVDDSREIDAENSDRPFVVVVIVVAMLCRIPPKTPHTHNAYECVWCVRTFAHRIESDDIQRSFAEVHAPSWEDFFLVQIIADGDSTATIVCVCYFLIHSLTLSHCTMHKHRE